MYIVLISAVKLLEFRKRWLKLYMVRCVVEAFIHKYLVLLLIHYGSCLWIYRIW